jgi:NADH-quinone oxidoreductase subunit B
MELVGKDSSFFAINDELADKGFFVTSTDEMITWARTGSIYWVTFGARLLCGRDDAGHDAAL